MKLKRLISAVSAIAMAMSLITVSNASLGGKPAVTATLDSYQKMNDTAAFAYVNIKMDASAAEDLEVYSSEFDMTSFQNVTKGNGISTMGISLTLPSHFMAYVPSMSTIPTGVAVNTLGDSIYIAPIDTPANYIVDEVITVKLAYAVNNFDASGELKVTEATLDGKNSATNEVWGYASLAGTMTVAGCDIPSYNEWSTPAATATPVVTEAPTPTPTVTPTPTPTVEPTPVAPTSGKGKVEIAEDAKDAAVWAWETAAVAGTKLAVTVTDGNEQRTKEFALNANVDATIKVGVIVQYDPTVYPLFDIVKVEVK